MTAHEDDERLVRPTSGTPTARVAATGSARVGATTGPTTTCRRPAGEPVRTPRSDALAVAARARRAERAGPPALWFVLLDADGPHAPGRPADHRRAAARRPRGRASSPRRAGVGARRATDRAGRCSSGSCAPPAETAARSRPRGRGRCARPPTTIGVRLWGCRRDRREPRPGARVVRLRPTGPGDASSIAASCSSVGSHRIDATFARSCSGVRAPAMTVATAGWAASPPSASVGRSTPHSRGQRRQRLDAVEVGARQPVGHARQPEPSGAASSRRYLPVSRPEASGTYGMSPTPDLLERRAPARPRRVAVEQVVPVLGGDERRRAGGPRAPVGVDHLPGGEVRRAEVPDLALDHQLVQRGEGLLDRRHRVGHVHLVAGRSGRCRAGAASSRRPRGRTARDPRDAPVGAVEPACPCRTCVATHDVVAVAGRAPHPGAPRSGPDVPP